jgi:hypothetical protein
MNDIILQSRLLRIEDHLLIFSGKQGHVWTEFKEVKNCLELYLGDRVVSKEIVEGRKFYKIKVKDLRNAYTLMDAMYMQIWGDYET